jgi:4-hydroxy-tetrahydrodipicolinate reductase
MNIALVGYGKMGQTIEGILKERGHHISYIIDSHNLSDISDIRPENTDAVIEFTHPEAAFDNISTLIKQNLKVVSGTTGWLHRRSEIEELAKQSEGAFFYASNYSIGVNIFFKLNEYLATLMNGQPDYNVMMEEVHHTQKKDAPSGTAITLAEGVIGKMDHLKKWVDDKASSSDELPIVAIRKDDVPGTHTVTYDSEIDRIDITHTAHTRKGFALGAVLVAEWIKDKKGVLGMNDFLPF